MEFFHVSHCLLLFLAVYHYLFLHMELLHISHYLNGLWLSLTVYLVPKRCYMFLSVSSSSLELLHVSNCLLWLLAVFPSAMELLYVSHGRLWLLAISHCLFGPMKMLHVPH